MERGIRALNSEFRKDRCKGRASMFETLVDFSTIFETFDISTFFDNRSTVAFPLVAQYKNIRTTQAFHRDFHFLSEASWIVARNLNGHSKYRPLFFIETGRVRHKLNNVEITEKFRENFADDRKLFRI